MESDLIDWLRRRLPPHPCLRLGIGDDAAVLRTAERTDCVVTVDLLSDQVHFVLADTHPKRVGRKALAVSLSDLAGMAAEPMAAVVALSLPRRAGFELAVELYSGMLPLADEFGVAIAGGDTNSWDGPLVISVTAIGTVAGQGPLLRSGARPGDQILVTGRLGGSRLGRHFDFVPRIREALLLGSRYSLHAGMDVSDGLAIDLNRLAVESDCGAVVAVDDLPIAEAAHEAVRRGTAGESPIDHALSDGEDFELLLAVPTSEAKRMLEEQPLECGLTRIGEFVAEVGLWQTGTDGQRRELEPRGYLHRFEL